MYKVAKILSKLGLNNRCNKMLYKINTCPIKSTPNKGLCPITKLFNLNYVKRSNKEFYDYIPNLDCISVMDPNLFKVHSTVSLRTPNYFSSRFNCIKLKSIASF